MNVAIIGAGNVGSALARGFTRAGHTVSISSANRETAGAVAGETGARAASSNGDAVRGAEVVVLAVPHSAVLGIVDELGDELAGKVIVDATNQLNADYSSLTHWDVSAAEQIQQRAGGKVVKAFNTVFASTMSTGTVGETQLDAFIAGDDDSAKRTVADLAESIGFHVIDVGELAKARVLEGMALMNINLQMRYGWSWQTGFKLVGPMGPSQT
jgi:8-hydroxy-5-deazaflavin:NADPH oxidoreductase